jgi:hypothetical protein
MKQEALILNWPLRAYAGVLTAGTGSEPSTGTQFGFLNKGDLPVGEAKSFKIVSTTGFASFGAAATLCLSCTRVSPDFVQ